MPHFPSLWADVAPEQQPEARLPAAPVGKDQSSIEKQAQIDS